MKDICNEDQKNLKKFEELNEKLKELSQEQKKEKN